MKKISILSLSLLLSLSIYCQDNKKESKYETITIQTSAQCEQCKDRLESNLSFEKGVKDVRLDMETMKLSIKFRKGKTSIETLKLAVSKIGYDADDILADPVAYERLPKCCKKGGHDG